MAYIGKQPVVGNFVKLDAITTSATATYNLLNGGVAYFPQTANNCIVSLNGVIQSPTSAYTISGSTIVFDSALTSNDSIDFILVLGDVLNIGTPSDSTVGFAKVTSNLITGATAETSIAGGDSVLIYDDSASALRKMTRTNFVSGIGGSNTPAFSAYLTGSSSIANTTYTEVLFNGEYFDTANLYSTSTGRFTPSTSGKYFFFSNIIIDSVGDQKFLLVELRKNGTAFSYSQTFMSGASGNMSSEVCGSIEMNGSTDYVSIFIYHNKGSSTNIFTPSDFGGFKIIE